MAIEEDEDDELEEDKDEAEAEEPEESSEEPEEPEEDDEDDDEEGEDEDDEEGEDEDDEGEEEMKGLDQPKMIATGVAIGVLALSLWGVFRRGTALSGLEGSKFGKLTVKVWDRINTKPAAGTDVLVRTITGATVGEGKTNEGGIIVFDNVPMDTYVRVFPGNKTLQIPASGHSVVSLTWPS